MCGESWERNFSFKKRGKRSEKWEKGGSEATEKGRKTGDLRRIGMRNGAEKRKTGEIRANWAGFFLWFFFLLLIIQLETQSLVKVGFDSLFFLIIFASFCYTNNNNNDQQNTKNDKPAHTYATKKTSFARRIFSRFWEFWYYLF